MSSSALRFEGYRLVTAPAPPVFRL